jgi:uracil-DNA glycosylase
LLLDDVWGFIEREVFPIASGPGIINVYQYEDSTEDVAGAAELRRENLGQYLAGIPERPKVLIVGKAPSSHGFRFSGVPFVSEVQLLDPAFPFHGRATSRRSAEGRPFASGHDTKFWNIMADYIGPRYPRFLVWNCIPFFPRDAGTGEAREPGPREVARYAQITLGLTELLAPEVVAALGQPAQDALRGVGVPCKGVHAVSQDPRGEFKKGMAGIMLPFLAR